MYILQIFFLTIYQSISNPCDSPILKKTFKAAKGQPWTILDKDVVDEIIFKTNNRRNRLMLELMARGGMRIGEVLKLRANNMNIFIDNINASLLLKNQLFGF